MSIAITTMQVITTATTSVATIRITRDAKEDEDEEDDDEDEGQLAKAMRNRTSSPSPTVETESLPRPWRDMTGGPTRCTPRCRSYTRMVEPVCRGPSRRGTASICAGGPSYRQGSSCQKISASPERPALGMCVTLQSPPGLRIGLLAERRCREKVGMEIHPYFCPTFASRAANWSCLPSRGAAEKVQVEPSFRPTGADANRPQRSLGDDS